MKISEILNEAVINMENPTEINKWLDRLRAIVATSNQIGERQNAQSLIDKLEKQLLNLKTTRSFGNWHNQGATNPRDRKEIGSPTYVNLTAKAMKKLGIPFDKDSDYGTTVVFKNDQNQYVNVYQRNFINQNKILVSLRITTDSDQNAVDNLAALLTKISDETQPINLIA